MDDTVANLALGGATVYQCPACQEWQLECPTAWPDLREINDIVKTHLLDCFGIPT